MCIHFNIIDESTNKLRYPTRVERAGNSFGLQRSWRQLSQHVQRHLLRNGHNTVRRSALPRATRKTAQNLIGQIRDGHSPSNQNYIKLKIT